MRENDTKKLEVAMKYFQANSGYKDCKEKVQECQRLINQLTVDASDNLLAPKKAKEGNVIEDVIGVFAEINDWF